MRASRCFTKSFTASLQYHFHQILCNLKCTLATCMLCPTSKFKHSPIIYQYSFFPMSQVTSCPVKVSDLDSSHVRKDSVRSPIYTLQSIIKTEILFKRAVNILMRMGMGHTMVSATKASSVTLYTVYIRAYAEQTVTERTDVYRSTRLFAPKMFCTVLYPKLYASNVLLYRPCMSIYYLPKHHNFRHGSLVV